MELLLDTHIILWVLTEDPRVTSEIREIITNPRHKLYYSMISMWEVAIKKSSGKTMPINGVEFMHYCEACGYERLPLEDRHVCAYETLVHNENYPEHKDPFDKMLLAQAKADGMLLITHDNKFKAFNEPYVRIV